MTVPILIVLVLLALIGGALQVISRIDIESKNTTHTMPPPNPGRRDARRDIPSDSATRIPSRQWF